MLEIHGISFQDWAATNAFLAHGKGIAELLPMLGVEMSEWDEANTYWDNRLSSDADSSMITEFGVIFACPYVGKYAHRVQRRRSIDEALSMCPTFEDYVRLLEHQNVGSKYGMGSQQIICQYGMDIHDWQHTERHWGGYMQANMQSAEFMQQIAISHMKYEALFEHLYSAMPPTLI